MNRKYIYLYCWRNIDVCMTGARSFTNLTKRSKLNNTADDDDDDVA